MSLKAETKVLAAYIPVLHTGYVKFLSKHKDAKYLYIYTKDTTNISEYLRKEIRELPFSDVKKLIYSLGFSFKIKKLDNKALDQLKKSNYKIVFSNEDISRELANKHFKGKSVAFDDIFLRWDRQNTLKKHKITVDTEISTDQLDRELMGKAALESSKSSDWWRHVGAIVVKNNKVLLYAHNKHVPSQHMPYVNGDPRNAFKKGMNVDYATSLHAEAAIIVEAAKRGISLQGTKMYITTFPCPTCAKLVAYSGVKELFFSKGYAMLDGESILKSKDVKIIRVV